MQEKAIKLDITGQKSEGINEDRNTETGQRDRDEKIESGPENGEVQLGQRWRDSSASKVQSVKERGFSVEFREAVNPEGSAIQTNIYSANRIRRGRGWTDARQLLFKCMCGAAQYEENEMKTIYAYLRTPPPI